jgi:hypothetical protein
MASGAAKIWKYATRRQHKSVWRRLLKLLAATDTVKQNI